MSYNDAVRAMWEGIERIGGKPKWTHFPITEEQTDGNKMCKRLVGFIYALEETHKLKSNSLVKLVFTDRNEYNDLVVASIIKE